MNPEHKKYILENIKKKTLQEIASALHLKEKVVRRLVQKESAGQNKDLPEGKERHLKERKVVLRKGEFIVPICIIIIVVICAFAPALKNGFVNWDDPAYVTENPYLSHISLANIKTLLTTPFVGTYQPVVNITYLLEHHFFDLNASFYHATNILLHTLNCILVFWLLLILDGNILVALLAALLFGLHPLRVESVAWISERKDVLYSFFYLWALIDYCRYIKNNSSKYYYRSLFLFLLSLGSKAMAVTLPLVFFAVDYLLKRRFDKKTILEKVPFFILAFLFGIIAIFTQGKALGLGHVEPSIPSHQLSAPFYGILMYLYKTVIPTNLSAIYPYPPQNAGFYLLCLLSVVIICLIVWAAIISRRFTRKVNFALLFSFITILPVLQFIPIGIAIMADRYTYMPSIGICYIISAGFFYLYNMKHKHTPMLRLTQIILLACIIAVFSVLTYNRTQVWKDTIAVFSDVIKKYPNYHMVYNNRGVDYEEQGNFTQAIYDFNKAIEINPRYADAYNNRGLAYDQQGKLPQAILDFNKAIEINPHYAEAYNNRGDNYAKQGKLPQAISDYTKAIEINPRYADAYNNRGLAYGKQGNLPQAISDYTKAIGANPNHAEAYNNRGLDYAKQGNFTEAMYDFNKAMEINPNYAEAYNNRGFAYGNQGNSSQAILDFDKTIEINPNYAPAYNNRGTAYAKQGKMLQAISDCTKAIEIDTNYAEAYNSRGLIYCHEKEYDKAWADVQKAESLGYKVKPEFIEILKKASGREK